MCSLALASVTALVVTVTIKGRRVEILEGLARTVAGPTTVMRPPAFASISSRSIALVRNKRSGGAGRNFNSSGNKNTNSVNSALHTTTTNSDNNNTYSVNNAWHTATTNSNNGNDHNNIERGASNASVTAVNDEEDVEFSELTVVLPNQKKRSDNPARQNNSFFGGKRGHKKMWLFANNRNNNDNVARPEQPHTRFPSSFGLSSSSFSYSSSSPAFSLSSCSSDSSIAPTTRPFPRDAAGRITAEALARGFETSKSPLRFHCGAGGWWSSGKGWFAGAPGMVDVPDVSRSAAPLPPATPPPASSAEQAAPRSGSTSEEKTVTDDVASPSTPPPPPLLQPRPLGVSPVRAIAGIGSRTRLFAATKNWGSGEVNAAGGFDGRGRCARVGPTLAVDERLSVQVNSSSEDGEDRRDDWGQPGFSPLTTTEVRGAAKQYVGGVRAAYSPMTDSGEFPSTDQRQPWEVETAIVRQQQQQQQDQQRQDQQRFEPLVSPAYRLLSVPEHRQLQPRQQQHDLSQVWALDHEESPAVITIGGIP